ncbi:MAG: pyruvate ferredoxin oxidoreductase [Lewinellaceae bacterium]|nr:pyruvate ferredoxin oxidoreductase [Lewinellaceae bacterium]
MDYKVMEQLLDKYFEGETSLQEEGRLREYFQRPEVPEALQPYQPLFQHLEQERTLELGAAFDQKLLQKLETARPQAKVRHLGVRSWVLRIAAALAIGFGLWWAYITQDALQAPQQAGIDWSKYEVNSPEDAFRLTSTALLKASSELNRGTSTAAHEMDKLKKVGKYFK